MIFCFIFAIDLATASARCFPILEFLGKKEALYKLWHPDSDVQKLDPSNIPSVSQPISVYFYDIDVNLLILPSHVYLRHKVTDKETRITSAEYDRVSDQIGQLWTDWENYYLIHDDNSPVAAHREARDLSDPDIFVKQVRRALEESVHEDHWMGRGFVPWFIHLKNPSLAGRVGLITSRGHEPENIHRGLQVLSDRNLIPRNIDTSLIFTATNPNLTDFFYKKYQLDPDLMEAEGVPHQYVKKAMIMVEILDLLSSIPIDPSSKDQVHHFKYSDDSWSMLRHIMQILEAYQVRNNRWPNVKLHFYSTSTGNMGKFEIDENGLQQVR